MSNHIFKSLSLSKKINQEIYLANETINPTGSHKDRSFSVWIAKEVASGAEGFVISSSGNAAAAAAYWCNKFKRSLEIFVSEKIKKEKLRKIVSFCHPRIHQSVKQAHQNLGIIKIHLVKKPIFEAFQLAKKSGFVFLRASISPQALVGYQSLAEEIDITIPNLGSIFIPASSGTLVVGLYQYLKSKPQFHVVQTTMVNTLVKDFDQNYTLESMSTADAVVDVVGHRKPEVVEIIKNSHGFGWTISNQELKLAQDELKPMNINCSATSALGLAGLLKAKQKKFKTQEPILIIIT